MSKPKELKIGLVADGIYRLKGGGLFERPWVRGKRTWRSLETKNLKLAKEELHRRRSGLQPKKEESDSEVTVGDVIRAYVEVGYPDDQRQQRPDCTKIKEARFCRNLLPFWDRVLASEVTNKICDDYSDYRVKAIQKKQPTRNGTRAVDLDLNTLSNAFSWATRTELVDRNPLRDRPGYHTSAMVRHCRETMPANADEAHRVAGVFFNRRSNSVVLGFQTLIEWLTGLRTAEAILLRTDAQPNEPGYDDGKYLCVRRVKKQHAVNPFCLITPALRAVLDAHAEWKAARYQDSPWFLPSPDDPAEHVGETALARALLRLDTKGCGHKVTSHGLRAGYVLIRRSQGATDAQIAAELGHLTGGSTVEKVYGGIPINWLNGGGPNLSWEPTTDPAWHTRQKNGWKCSSPEDSLEP